MVTAPKVPKQWYTWVVLVLFILVFLVSLITLDTIIYGLCLYYIYNRNIIGHRIYFVYGGLVLFVALFTGAIDLFVLILIVLVLLYLDYDFIRKAQQGLLQDPTSLYQNQSQGFSNPTSNPNKTLVTPIKIESKPLQNDSSAAPLNFCGNCGAKIFDNETKFCQNCGKPINN